MRISRAAEESGKPAKNLCMLAILMIKLGVLCTSFFFFFLFAAHK